MNIVPGPGRTPGDTGPHLIGLQGYSRSGKDSVASVLGGYGYTRVAFADPLRDALYTLNPMLVELGGLGELRVRGEVDAYGWEVSKDLYPEVRRLLKVLGTEVVRDIVGENVWVDIAVHKIEAIVGAVVVTDVRFPNEVEAIRQRGGQIWQIERPDHGPLDGHSSEALPCPDPDARIFNHSTLESLDSQVELVLRCAK